MSDLRKAAEAVLEAWGWDWSEPRNEALRERMEALRQALAQAEQEPVAWLRPSGEIVVRTDYGGRLYYSEQNVYTAPPKREWVGLTDDELKPLCDEWQIIYGGYVRPFAETIEAKLKEKNT